MKNYESFGSSNRLAQHGFKIGLGCMALVLGGLGSFQMLEGQHLTNNASTEAIYGTGYGSQYQYDQESATASYQAAMIEFGGALVCTMMISASVLNTERKHRKEEAQLQALTDNGIDQIASYLQSQ